MYLYMIQVQIQEDITNGLERGVKKWIQGFLLLYMC